MIHYKRVKIKDLEGYIQSTSYLNNQVLPVSKHRALSYINNPRAHSDDVVLYLAYQEESLIAYRMILPDMLYLNGKETKIGWFSCLYVDAAQRGKGIAKMLTTMALEDWSERILYHDPVTASGTLYLSSGQFVPWKKVEGLRCFLGINLLHFLSSRRLSGLFRFPLLAIENTVNFFLFLAIKPKKHKGVEFQEEKEITTECANYIESNNQNEFIRRGGEELNWILRYPWIIQSRNNPIADRYYFSAYEKQFSYLNMTIRGDDNEIIGFLMFLIKNKQMKLLYLHCSDELIPSVYDELLRLMKTNKIQTFSCYDKRLVAYLREHKNAFFLMREKTKPLFVSKKLMPALSESDQRFQDGDGDNSFT